MIQITQAKIPGLLFSFPKRKIAIIEKSTLNGHMVSMVAITLTTKIFSKIWRQNENELYFDRSICREWHLKGFFHDVSLKTWKYLLYPSIRCYDNSVWLSWAAAFDWSCEVDSNPINSQSIAAVYHYQNCSSGESSWQRKWLLQKAHMIAVSSEMTTITMTLLVSFYFIFWRGVMNRQLIIPFALIFNSLFFIHSP